MDKIIFEDLPNTETPINSKNLNQVQDNTETSITELINKIGNWGNTEALDDYTGDLNDIDQTGFVMANSSTVNIPYTDAWYILTLIKSKDNYIVQIAISRNNANQLYSRIKFGGTWLAWYRVTQPIITTGTEFETGRIIDGKKEYGKKINVGYLKSGTMTINHGISNISAFTGAEGYFLNENSGTFFAVPRSYPSDQAKYGVDLTTTTTAITLTCGTNYTGVTFKGYVTLYYTKN